MFECKPTCIVDLTKEPLKEEIATERDVWLDCAELAVLYRLRVAVVRKLFIDEPGVMRLRNRRGPDTLRIPRDVAERVIRRLTVGGGDDAVA